MSAPPDRARLYYDAGCGPCSLFARISEWASRSRVAALPYDGEDAARELADVEAEARFTSAHLLDDRGRHSGAEMMAPLFGMTLGRTGERVLARVPAVDRSLRWMYLRFWNYRRTRGCAARAAASSS